MAVLLKSCARLVRRCVVWLSTQADVDAGFRAFTSKISLPSIRPILSKLVSGPQSPSTSRIMNLYATARILRFLTNHHIFREVSPDVFASNRLSSVLDSGKPSAEIVPKCVPLTSLVLNLYFYYPI